MSYLQLFPTARYEYYGEDGCLFDLLGTKRFYLEKEYAKHMSDLLNGEEYKREEYPDDFNDVISNLFKEGMAYIYEKPKYHEAIKFHNSIEIKGIYDQPPFLSNVYIEASDSCESSCSFCDMSAVNEGCRSCIKWNRKGDNLSRKKLLATVERILHMRLKKLTILGGNPLLNWEYVSAVISIARERQEDIAIILHLPVLDVSDEVINFLKENRVDVKVLIMYNKWSTSARDKHLTTALKKMRSTGLNVQPVLMGTYAEISQMSQGLNAEQEEWETVEVIDYVNVPQTSLKHQERKNLQPDTVFVQKKGNRCLNNKIALSLTGDISVCPALGVTLANVAEGKIEDAFYDYKIGAYWEMDREQIEDCNKCALKWLCNDCVNALQHANSRGLGGKYFCGYNA